MLQEERMRPNWPAWYGLAALGIALVVALFASGILFALLAAVGANVDSNSPGVTLAATLIQDGALVVAALWLAAKVAPPRPEQFGLRAVPFLRGLKWAAIAFAIFFAFQILYVAAVHPDQKQTTLNDLGAGSSIAVTILIGVLVVGVAPAVEEFFFRGFFYGALRSQFPFLAAALIDGLVFGLVHAPTGIEAVPPLIALGFAFCVAYEATGSILPGIVLHALNNMIAFGSDKDGSWAVGAITAVAVVTAVLILPRRSRTLQ
jgi:hypothetical protein